jgi:hypothetical protein
MSKNASFVFVVACGAIASAILIIQNHYNVNFFLVAISNLFLNMFIFYAAYRSVNIPQNIIHAVKSGVLISVPIFGLWLLTAYFWFSSMLVLTIVQLISTLINGFLYGDLVALHMCKTMEAREICRVKGLVGSTPLIILYLVMLYNFLSTGSENTVINEVLVTYLTTIGMIGMMILPVSTAFDFRYSQLAETKHSS